MPEMANEKSRKARLPHCTNNCQSSCSKQWTVLGRRWPQAVSALSILEHGFALHKGAFRDTLCLRYGWHPGHLPTECACGRRFTVDHALSCHCGGFPSLHHNKIRDVTADLLNEICHNVSTELELQPLSGESLILRTANSQDGARLDVKAQGFW